MVTPSRFLSVAVQRYTLTAGFPERHERMSNPHSCSSTIAPQR
ncbi:hypothetical protein TOK_0471 [Pseudonocardia sp. N23]|nr:hypothetical protein TOK_0471 [Pseudonocardia sp. N23]